ncbi:uncharacterized protein PRCAT00006115001 [Priceomyces carsonii]|uniref:uncharacterized protein n=1 Tax=Priceomyces carsonii TaxID=28549 RepID=UPI002EDAB501|nr:unnamed protein product [Priceomyces carsonii]
MDYSERVNSKKGAGSVADFQEANVHTKRRLKELLTTQVLDLDNDPYVFRNHLGLLECKLCLTTHVSESSYISHLGGRKHQMNLEKRRILDERLNKKLVPTANVISINNTPKRSWRKIGKPSYNVTKIRDPQTLQMGLLFHVKYPKITTEEPFFRFMSYYELSTKNQNVVVSYLDRTSDESEEIDGQKLQYLVLSAEPYENICFIIPSHSEIDKPDDSNEMSTGYWWYWDKDTKEFYLQFLYK